MASEPLKASNSPCFTQWDAYQSRKSPTDSAEEANRVGVLGTDSQAGPGIAKCSGPVFFLVVATRSGPNQAVLR